MRRSMVAAVALILATGCGDSASSEHPAGGGSGAAGASAAGNPSGGGSDGLAGDGSSGTGDASGAGGGPSAGDCNAVVNGAPWVTYTAVAEDVPAALGGSLIDGTYYLTEYRDYRGPGGSTVVNRPLSLQVTTVVSSSTGSSAKSQSVQDRVDNGIQSGPLRMNADFNLTGGSLVMNMTCPGAETGSPTPYTATATQFITYTNGSGGTRAAVLTRQ